MRNWVVGLGCAVAFFSHGILAQSVKGQTASDSLKSYDLSEIVIGGEVRQLGAPPRLHRVGLAGIVNQDKSDIAGVLRMLPSAHVQTNSRGETLVYIRGAGERQVAVFLDGAPLNVGWDNRVDLSMIPSNVLGDMALERGAISSAYGPGVPGGALNLHVRSISNSSSIKEITLQGGQPTSWQAKALYAKKLNRTSWLLGGSASQSDGFRTSSSSSLPFSQSGSMRTNSDRSTNALFSKVAHDFNGGAVGLTVFHVSSEKGVPPESHLDPTEESVRYWRYPEWRNTMAIVNAAYTMYPVHFSSTVWASRFGQQIDQYDTQAYAQRNFVQKDVDVSGGVRGVAEWKINDLAIRGIGFVSSTRHEQEDIEIFETNSLSVPTMVYSNVMYTMGSELGVPNGKGGHLVAGIALEGMNTPTTGDKPAQPSLQEWSFTLETDIPLGSNWEMLINAGKKPRFPTLRELYGVALDRFVLNEDLKSESTWLGEVGLGHRTSQYAFQVTSFIQKTKDTIDQTNIDVDGVRKRQRINLNGSRVIGLETNVFVRVSEQVTVDGLATILRPVALLEEGQSHLSEKPETLVTLNVEVDLTTRLRFRSSVVYTGRAYGLGLDNNFVALPTSTEVNFRASYGAFFANPGVYVEGYVGGDNVFDANTLPQLGLPSAGRSGRIGLNISF